MISPLRRKPAPVVGFCAAPDLAVKPFGPTGTDQDRWGPMRTDADANGLATLSGKAIRCAGAARGVGATSSCPGSLLGPSQAKLLLDRVQVLECRIQLSRRFGP